MTISIPVFSLFHFAASLLALYSATLVWSRRKARGATFLLTTLLLVAAWCFSCGLDRSLLEFDQKVLLGKITYGLVVFISVFLLLTVMEMLTDKAVTWKQTATLLIFPITINLLALTNDFHHLVWSGFSIADSAQNIVVFQHAPFFWVGVVIQFSLLGYTTYQLIKAATNAQTRNKAIILLIGVVSPLITSALHLLGYSVIPNLDISPFGFLITAPLFLFGIDRFGLLDMGTIGRATYTDRTIDAIIILNNNEDVVEFNRSAETIFGVVKGSNINQYPIILTALDTKNISNSEKVFSNNIEIHKGSAQLTYNLSSEDMLSKDGSSLGKILILRDITQALITAKGLEEAEISVVQENERKRLGKEIHDRISQGLYSLSLFSATAKNHALRGNEIKVMELIDEINAMAQQVIKETNLLFYELEPESFYKIGMVKALNEQAEVISSRYDVPIVYNFNFTSNIPLDFQRILYNTISEINNHVLGYSRPDQIITSLTDVSNNFNIEVAIYDNKMIKSVIKNNHIDKFDNLITKLSKLNGSFEIIDPTPGKKFIIVELPISYI